MISNSTRFNELPSLLLFLAPVYSFLETENGVSFVHFTGEDRVDCVSRGFRITDPRGGILFSADREQVVVGAEMLRVTGDGGAVFQGSVQTPLVRGESGRGLR